MLTAKPSPGIFDRIAQLLFEYEQAKRAGVRAEVLTEIASRLLEAIGTLAQSPMTAQALAILLKIGKNRMQTMLDEAQLSPCEAAKAAANARQAYAAFDSAVAFLRDWTAVRHFWSLPFRQRLEVRIPPSDIRLQIVTLEGFLDSALKATDLGLVVFLHQRDVRVPLGADTGQTPVPAVLETDYLIDLPNEPFRSGNARVKEMRKLLLQFSRQLKQASKQGRKALKRGTLDKEGTAVRAATVSAVLTQLNYLLVSGILTCAALRRLASAPTLAEIQKQSAASNESNKWPN